MESKAVLRQLRIAPRKVRLLIGLIRGMRAEDAIVQLQLSKKHAAVPVRKLLESAMANAVHNHAMRPESLVITRAFVDEGPTLKRWKPRAFGRAAMIRKKYSHVTIVVEGTVDEALAKQKQLAKAAKKQDDSSEETADGQDVAATKKSAAKKTTKKVAKQSAKPKANTVAKGKKTVSRSAGRGR